VELANEFPEMRRDRGQVLMLFLWGVFHGIPKSNAQEAAFRWFVSEQVMSGQWLPSEGEIVLQYIEAKGRPVIPEEVLALVGLSNETRQHLYRAEAWVNLCTGKSATSMKKRTGPLLDIRSLAKTDASAYSIRLKNSGKWGIRCDGPWRLSSRAESHEIELSGYLQMRPFRNVRLLFGSHKIGWGNRLAQSEALFFSGLVSPAYAVPVHYDFVPIWGNISHGIRTGMACSFRRSNWEAVVSSDGLSSHSRWAAMARRSLSWGAVGFTIERGWIENGAESGLSPSWLVSGFASGSKKGWHWSFELIPMPLNQSFSVTWQRSVGRDWDGFGVFEMRKGWIRDHENRVISWQDQLDLSLGMQWKLGAGDIRGRFLMEGSSSGFSVQHAIRSSVVAHLNQWHRLEIHAQVKGEYEGALVAPSRRRVGFRWRFEDSSFAGNIRVEWCPDSGRDGLGWAGVLGGDIGPWDLKWGIAQWKMMPHQVGYYTTPSFDGIRMHGMHHYGTRVSFRISRKINPNGKFNSQDSKAIPQIRWSNSQVFRHWPMHKVNFNSV